MCTGMRLSAEVGAQAAPMITKNQTHKSDIENLTQDFSHMKMQHWTSTLSQKPLVVDIQGTTTSPDVKIFLESRK